MKKSTLEKFTAAIIAITILSIALLSLFTSLSALSLGVGGFVGAMATTLVFAAWLFYLGATELERKGDE